MKEEDDAPPTPKKERDSKAKRLVKRSRTSFGPGDTSAVVAARAGSMDTLTQDKSLVKPGKEGVSSGEGSPGTSPRIRSERSPATTRASGASGGALSPRSSPSTGRRQHDSSLTSPKARRAHRHSGNFRDDELTSRHTSTATSTTTSSSSPPPHAFLSTNNHVNPPHSGSGILSGQSSSPLTATSALSLSAATHANSSLSGGSSPASAHLLTQDDFGETRSSHGEATGATQNVGPGLQEIVEVALAPEPTALVARLVRVHGARNNIHASLVPRLASSLNKNDCFILDNATGVLYTWKGKSANMFAKSECSDVANAVNQATYAGKAQILNVEQTLEPQAFWDALVSGRGDIADADTTGITSLVRFFKLPFDANTYNSPDSTPSSAIGAFSLAEEGKGQMRPSLITSAPITAIDTGFEIIVCDNTKDLQEPIPEQLLIDAARRYKRDANRPAEVRISVVRGANARHPLITHYLK